MKDAIKYIKQRLSECSIIFLLYLGIGALLAFVIGCIAYALIYVWAVFMSTGHSSLIENNGALLRNILIAVCEVVYILIMLKAVFMDTGDTVLIEIIKHIDTVKGAKLINEYKIRYNLSDISIYDSDNEEHNIEDIRMFKQFNTLQHGYVRFNSIKDTCFTNDVKVSDEIKDTDSTVILHIRQYQYRGIKLMGRQTINQFLLKQDTGETTIGTTLPEDYTHNEYITRLWSKKVYDYPISLKSDVADGLRKSYIYIIIILLCTVLMFARGLLVGYQSDTFLEDFTTAGTQSGITILTDNHEKYNKYSILIQDSIALLPQKLRSEFINKGWSLVFVENDLADYPILSKTISEGETSGCTFPNYQIIVIQYPGYKAIETEYFMNTIVHEFGHFFTISDSGLSDSWMTVYEEEKDTYTREYARTNPSEGFACAFASYILDEPDFCIKSPKTYTYIDKLIQNYINTEK